jgi:hypothetical protein
MSMRNDIDFILDDLLALWHRFADNYTETKGYARASPMFRDTKSNWSPYDRDNNVPEQEAEATLARAIGAALFRVPNTPQLWRSVLMFEARTLACGYRVWSSVRLPSGEEYQVLRLEARNKLLVELRRDGVVG